MDNKLSAAIGAALGVAATVLTTKLIAYIKAPNGYTAEEAACLEEELTKARAEGWFSGRDHLLEQLARIGGRVFDPDQTEIQ